MSVWSDEVIVVEAGAKSGAVVTGEFAMKNKRRVYAVPNNIFMSSSDGCNELIRKGAIPYLCKHETLSKQHKKNNLQKSPVLELLKAFPSTVQNLSEKLNQEIDSIQRELLILELEEQVKFLPDAKWHYTGW